MQPPTVSRHEDNRSSVDDLKLGLRDHLRFHLTPTASGRGSLFLNIRQLSRTPPVLRFRQFDPEATRFVYFYTSLLFQIVFR